MRHALISLLLLGSLAAASQAREPDDTPIYDGTWTLRGPGGQAAQLRIDQWDGTWRETGTKRVAMGAACRAKPFPVTIHHSNPTVLEFTAWGSAVGAGCPDLSYTFKPVDAKSLQGTTAGGEAVTMSLVKKR